MLNAEMYKEELKALTVEDGFTNLAVDKQGHPRNCGGFDCSNCQFRHETSCSVARLDWLTSEYEERTISHNGLTVDTAIYVSDHEEPTFDPEQHKPAHYAGWDDELNWVEVFRNGRTKFTNGDRDTIAYSYAWLPDGTKIV